MKTQAEADALLSIKLPTDIKELVILEEYVDDHQQCAETTINGIRVDFMWYDNLSFLYYATESAKAFTALLNAIKHSVEVSIESDFEY
jgi:hypothetical protein